MHLTRIVLSFDDGRKDNYRVAFEILKKKNLPATFNITSGYIEQNISQVDLCVNDPMSVEELKKIASDPLFEIAGHGYAHKNSLADWKKGMIHLKQWLPEGYLDRGYGAASPHSVITEKSMNEQDSVFDLENIKYIRTGLKNQHSLIQRGISKLARLTGNCYLSYIPIRNSLLQIKRGDRLIYSVPVLNPHSFEQVKYIIDKTIKHHGDVVFQFHSIVKNNEAYYKDLYSWDYHKFESVCEYLSELQSKSVIDVVKNIDLI